MRFDHGAATGRNNVAGQPAMAGALAGVIRTPSARTAVPAQRSLLRPAGRVVFPPLRVRWYAGACAAEARRELVPTSLASRPKPAPGRNIGKQLTDIVQVIAQTPGLRYDDFGHLLENYADRQR